MKPVINLDEVQIEPRAQMFQPTGETADRFSAQRGNIGTVVGLQKLGCNLTVVPPGKCAYPLHSHLANEELFIIVEGSGELRFGSERYPVRRGDIVACPPGGPETAHQLANTGSVEMRYIAISTRLYPEVVEYPTSGKFGVIAERPPTADGKPSRLVYIGREEQGCDYWDGE
jgi:uncharacterized cupin superfamily protein